jgi:hypothetical protein
MDEGAISTSTHEVFKQPRASVAVRQYSPAARPKIVSFADVKPSGPDQASVYGALPPPITELIVPSLLFGQVSGVEVRSIVIAEGETPTFTQTVFSHPNASVAVRQYSPEAKPVMFSLTEVNPSGPVHANV